MRAAQRAEINFYKKTIIYHGMAPAVPIETHSHLGQPRVIKLFYIYNNINHKRYTLLDYL